MRAARPWLHLQSAEGSRLQPEQCCRHPEQEFGACWRDHRLFQFSQPQRASVLCVSGHRLLWSPAGHFSFPEPLGATAVGTEQGAEAEPGLPGHSREPHQHRMFPWSATAPELLSKCRDTTVPKQTAGTRGGPRSVLQYPPGPSLPSAPAHPDRDEGTVPLSLLTPSLSTSLAEDVQMTDKITISKQFKEKVIRPILKVWTVCSWLRFEVS